MKKSKFTLPNGISETLIRRIRKALIKNPQKHDHDKRKIYSVIENKKFLQMKWLINAKNTALVSDVPTAFICRLFETIK